MPIKGEMKVKLVTAERLRQKGAGCNELIRFKAEWPNGAEITLENLLRAAELDLDLLWWVQNCLPAPLRAALARQMAPLWAALARQVARLIWQLLKEEKG